MVFQNEINLFDKDVLISRFHDLNTQVTAVQGKIAAIISDTDIREYMNGNKTVYQKLTSVEMTVDGLRTTVQDTVEESERVSGLISKFLQSSNSIEARVQQVAENRCVAKAEIIARINESSEMDPNNPSSELQINADKISLKGKTIRLNSDNITIDSDYFKVSRTGSITATSGTIAKFTIGRADVGQSSERGFIRYGMTRLEDRTHNGIYIGTDGISLGKGSFRVTAAGDLYASSGTFGGDLAAAGGTFSGDLEAAGGTFSGSLRAARGTFSGSLSAADGTFTGNLRAAGGTFSGSLSAADGTFVGDVLVTQGTTGNFLQVRASDARLVGGNTGQEYGYIDGAAYFTDESTNPPSPRHGWRIDSNAILFTTNCIAVAEADNTTLTHWKGFSGELIWMVNVMGTSDYVPARFKFVHGLMVGIVT